MVKASVPDGSTVIVIFPFVANALMNATTRVVDPSPLPPPLKLVNEGNVVDIGGVIVSLVSAPEDGVNNA